MDFNLARQKSGSSAFSAMPRASVVRRVLQKLSTERLPRISLGQFRRT